jgi:AcrR family transcriptional regulator
VPRPRTVDDEQLLDAAQDVMFESGPAAFTLERAATRAGTSAATYVKRFGSKRELLLALNRRWVASVEPGLSEAVAGERTAYGRLRAAALWGFSDLDSPARAANQLGALALDLSDDEMRELLAEGWRLVQGRLAELAAAAIKAGELRSDLAPREVARALFAAGEGTRLAWSVEPKGSLTGRAEATVDLILTGLRPARQGQR